MYAGSSHEGLSSRRSERSFDADAPCAPNDNFLVAPGMTAARGEVDSTIIIYYLLYNKLIERGTPDGFRAPGRDQGSQGPGAAAGREVPDAARAEAAARRGDRGGGPGAGARRGARGGAVGAQP